MDFYKNQIDSYVKAFLQPTVVSAIISFIILYSDKIRIPISDKDGVIFSDYTRFAILFLLLSYLTKQPSVSLGLTMLIYSYVYFYAQDGSIERFAAGDAYSSFSFPYPEFIQMLKEEEQGAKENKEEKIENEETAHQKQQKDKRLLIKEQTMYKQKDLDVYREILPVSFPVTEEQPKIEKIRPDV